MLKYTIFFTFNSLHLPLGYTPLVGHMVNVVMVQSIRSNYNWRAISMTPVERVVGVTNLGISPHYFHANRGSHFMQMLKLGILKKMLTMNFQVNSPPRSNPRASIRVTNGLLDWELSNRHLLKNPRKRLAVIDNKG